MRGHWNQVGGLCIKNGIRLLGSQIPRKPTTIINNLSGAGALIVYEPSYNFDEIFEIGYLNFDLNNKNPVLFLGQYAHSAPFTPQTKIRIHHNHVYSSTTPTINIQFIEEKGGMYGLVDNNIIDDLCYPFRNTPDVMNATYWDSYVSIGWPYSPGDKYVLMHEDNIINLGTCSDRNDVNVLTDCPYSGRYAYRYNNIRTAQDAPPLFDLHGNYSGMWACFGAEIYGNKVTLGLGNGHMFKCVMVKP